MRFNCFFVIAVATFLASTDKTSATSNSDVVLTPDLPVTGFTFTDSNNGKRHLRTGTTEDEDERAVTTLKIPALENALKRANAKRVRGWLKKGYEVDDVFLTLNLDLMTGNIFANPKFKTWMKFAIAAEGENAGKEIIMSLTRKYGDLKLAKMLRWTNSGSTASISKQLQKAQFDFWYKEGMGPKYITTNVFKEADESIIGELGRSILSQYRTYLNNNHPDWSKVMK
ncbi:Secreted RxLR effector peptide protein [Phytophthora palmivora]|uniref:RxLR effector protein n=1 Tax=Phytophthora palmivora TaxID=4796 RepID=A0A2P4YCK0_9STRA|nr:Secreted RxLR effector peptide protein [Phytophthora palmivora]